MESGLKNRIGTLIIAVLAIIYCLVEATGEGDFYIFMGAGSDLDEKIDIYTHKYLLVYNYYYSVFFALILSPFVSLPFYGVKFFWLLINSAMYIHLFYLLLNSDFVGRLNQSQKNWFMIGVFVFSLRFFRDNIHTSQITILLLWCSVYGLYLLRQNKNISGALILSLGMNIKLLPIVLLPYLIYRAYYKGFLFVIFFLVIMMFLPSVFIGHDYNMQLIASWFNSINPNNQWHILDTDERSFHGLTTLLSVLLVKNVPDPLALDIPRNIMDISFSALYKVILGARLFLIALTLYFLKWSPFQKEKTPKQFVFELSYILLLVPLIFPHQQHYGFLFIVPSFATTLYFLILNYLSISKNRRRLGIVLLSFIYLTGNLKILLGEWNYIYEHFKILTYGALLLIPVLIWMERWPVIPITDSSKE